MTPALLSAPAPRSTDALRPTHWRRAAAALLACMALAGCAQLPQAGSGPASLPDTAAPTPAMAGAVGPAGSGAAAATPAPAADLASPAVAAGAGPAAAAEGSTATISPPAANPNVAGPALLPASTSVARSRLDPTADSERSDLWARVRAGYAMPDLDGELVAKWEQWYGSRPDYVQRMTERGGRYLFYIVEEIERRGMPSDLALLPFIESAFNPQAVSSARASGMWQFMPATGRDFELRQNLFRDDRRSILASTQAALDYLQRLHTRFGDWHLALAAYNWGQGNVQRAIERNQKAGLGTRYTDLRMPDETRNYVPKLQAVKNLVARPSAYGLVLPPLQNHPFFLSVPVERDIDVALAARLAGLPLEDFQQLNPQMNKPVILAAGTPMLLLPYDNANQFLRGVASHRGPLASWTAWVAQRNIRPAEAARIVGMPEDRLREINRIPPRMLVKQGSTLLVPRAATAAHDVALHVADNAALALAPEARPLRRVTFKAKPGDTVASVARRYKLSPAQVAQWNRVGPQAKFKAGQSLMVMLAPAAAKKGAPARRGQKLAQTSAASQARAKPPASQRADRSRPQRLARN